MNKLTVLTAMCFALVTSSVQAELFGASVKPAPNATVLGQKITWPIPSLSLGKKAGTGVDANLSTKGVGFKIPFLAVNVPFPHAVVGLPDAKVSVGAHGVKTTGGKKSKGKKSKK
tara:strand:+ start:710 stop:1054 length:345 start_codon:yes stop_codon:yes gene_type:complete